MKYTRSSVRAMNPDEYRMALCNELNSAGFREHFNGDAFEYEPDEFIFSGNIENDPKAVDYLKSIGLLDNGKCPFCCEREDGLYVLQNLRNGVSVHVCEHCYKERSIQGKRKRGCFCCSAILLVVAIIIWFFIK